MGDSSREDEDPGHQGDGEGNSRRTAMCETHEALFDGIDEAIFIYDLEGTFVAANEEACRRLGYSEDELLGMTPWDIDAKDYPDVVGERMKTTEQDESITFETTHVTKTGERIPVEITESRIEYFGEPAVLNVARGLTDRKHLERKLERYEAYLEQSHDIITVLDADATIRYESRSVDGVLGYDADELVGETGFDLVHPDDVELMQELYSTLLDSPGGTATAECRFRGSDGEWRWLELRGANHLEDPHVGGVIFTSRDITEQKERTRELERHEGYLEESHDVITVVDVDGKVQFQSESAERLPGYSPGKLVFEHIHPEDRDEIREVFSSIKHRPDGEDSAELRVETPDGSWRWIEARGVNKLDDPVIDGVIISSRDITERKERERALSELHQAATDLEAAETEADVYAGLVDAAEEILDFALVAVDVVDGDELVPRARSVDRDSEAEVDRIPLEKETLETRAYHRRETIVANDLREEDVTPANSAYLSALTVPIGDIGIFQTASRDVEDFDAVDRELAELLVGHAEEVLQRLEHERSLRQQRKRLRRENERLDEFASVISHDLRNPLNVAQGRAAMFQDDGQKKHVEAIATALDRMEAMIADTLTLARQGETVGETERVDVRELVGECWGMVDTADATLEISEAFAIEGDRDRLQHVFENLFRNAIEHGDGDVTVRVGRAGTDTIYVEDDGPGIPETKREHVFDPGHTSASGGTGFGLTIVRRIVEAHGWEIDVTESEVGGARFEFSGITSE